MFWFVATPPSVYELTEHLEQLRALSIGMRVRVADACEVPPPGVDTAEDLQRAREHFVGQ